MNKDNPNEAGRVVSNTHPSAYLHKSVCIDYLKFRIDYNYAHSHDRFRELLKILQVKFNELCTTKGYNNYNHSVVIAPGITLLYGGDKTVTKMGRESSLLELKGKGCREFENRYYTHHKDFGKGNREEIIREGWIKLIEECLALEGICTRIDIPTDDFSGFITIDEIKEKVKAGQYATKMKCGGEVESNIESESILKKPDHLRDVQATFESKQKGYSVTFGSRDHVQLCIYDKHAEQNNKGIDVIADTWVRYEVRYYHKNAEQEILLLLEALRDGKETKQIVSCLAGMFEFKESSGFNKRNRSKAKTWSKWTEFIGDAGKKGYFSKTPVVTTVRTNASWLVRCASTSFARVVLSMGAPSVETMYALFVKGVGDLTDKDLQSINQDIQLSGGKPYNSIKEIQEMVVQEKQFPKQFSEKIVKYILSIGRKPENKDSNEKDKGTNDGN